MNLPVASQVVIVMTIESVGHGRSRRFSEQALGIWPVD